MIWNWLVDILDKLNIPYAVQQYIVSDKEWLGGGWQSDFIWELIEMILWKVIYHVQIGCQHRGKYSV